MTISFFIFYKDSFVPLLEACSIGHVGIAKLLLDNGADVYCKDDVGFN